MDIGITSLKVVVFDADGYLAIKTLIDEHRYKVTSLKYVDGMKKILGSLPAHIKWEELG